MPDFGFVLAPIVWLMEVVLSAYASLTNSVGFSIVLLSITFSLLLWPLQRLGLRAETKYAATASTVNSELKVLRDEGLKGERLFEGTEAIYKRHGYHPIQSVMSGASFVVGLPVLIASMVLFHQSPYIEGRSFLFISDLSKPDGTLALLDYPVNILPFIMFAVTLTDALLRYRGNAGARIRFVLISSLLLVLVYRMPAGLVLYWMVSNLTAFVTARLNNDWRPAIARADHR